MDVINTPDGPKAHPIRPGLRDCARVGRPTRGTCVFVFRLKERREKRRVLESDAHRGIDSGRHDDPEKKAVAYALPFRGYPTTDVFFWRIKKIKQYDYTTNRKQEAAFSRSIHAIGRPFRAIGRFLAPSAGRSSGNGHDMTAPSTSARLVPVVDLIRSIKSVPSAAAFLFILRTHTALVCINIMHARRAKRRRCRPTTRPL